MFKARLDLLETCSNTCNFLEVDSEVSDLTVVVYIMYI